MRSMWSTRTGRARGESNYGDYRYSKRQGRAKRGISLDPPGFDAGKKVKGRKRHILVDTLGLPLNVAVHPATEAELRAGLPGRAFRSWSPHDA